MKNALLTQPPGDSITVRRSKLRQLRHELSQDIGLLEVAGDAAFSQLQNRPKAAQIYQSSLKRLLALLGELDRLQEGECA